MIYVSKKCCLGQTSLLKPIRCDVVKSVTLKRFCTFSSDAACNIILVPLNKKPITLSIRCLCLFLPTSVACNGQEQ